MTWGSRGCRVGAAPIRKVPGLPGVRMMPASPESFPKLLRVMARLRAPDGCPWDREQDHESLKPYLIEEAYEVIEAVDSRDPARLREELGDLLLQVIFHCQLAEEAGRFGAFDVAEALAEKMIQRHPHVFGDVKAASSGEVLRNWEIAKRNGRAEKEEKGGAPSILDGVPGAMPALQRAQRLQGKAARVGFDWPDLEGAVVKLDEEWSELKKAIREKTRPAIAQEMGDFLFSAVNLSRKLKVNAEEAARSGVRQFIARFHYIEESLRTEGLSPEEVSLEKLEALWQEAKAREARPAPS